MAAVLPRILVFAVAVATAAAHPAVHPAAPKAPKAPAGVRAFREAHGHWVPSPALCPAKGGHPVAGFDAKWCRALPGVLATCVTRRRSVFMTLGPAGALAYHSYDFTAASKTPSTFVRRGSLTEVPGGKAIQLRFPNAGYAYVLDLRVGGAPSAHLRVIRARRPPKGDPSAAPFATIQTAACRFFSYDPARIAAALAPGRHLPAPSCNLGGRPARIAGGQAARLRALLVAGGAPKAAPRASSLDCRYVLVTQTAGACRVDRRPLSKARWPAARGLLDRIPHTDQGGAGSTWDSVNGPACAGHGQGTVCSYCFRGPPLPGTGR